MISVPLFAYLTLRYDISPSSVFSDTVSEFVEESHIIPIYDCYYKDAPQGKRGDEYCHYYIRNYVKKDASGGSSKFYDMIDPKLRICCRNGELFYSDSFHRFFERVERPITIFKYSGDSSSEVTIGTLEQMNITM